MPEIGLFAEDFAHKAFLEALLKRFGNEYRVDTRITTRLCHGSRVLAQLKQYIHDLRTDKERVLDKLVVAIDANCSGLVERKQQIRQFVKGYEDRIIYAIPDPHVERWLLLDSAAFRQVLGRGCSAPGYRCERDYYKGFLAQAVVDAGVQPILGGIEYAEDIANCMDLARMEHGHDADPSLAELLRALRIQFGEWSTTNQSL